VTRRWTILNGILAVIVLGFAVQIVRTWMRALPPIEARQAVAKGDATPRTGEGGKRGKRGQGDKAPATPAALVNVIVEKDLFDPSRTRQTEEAKSQAVVHETAPPPGITLVGVRSVGDDREGFILDATQANSQRRIRLGDAVGNFTVKRIRQSSILLVSAAGDFVTLTLELDKSKTQPASGRAGRGQAAAAGGSISPAAGVTAGLPTAAGVGSVPKPPVTATGTAAQMNVPPQPGETPPQTATPIGPKPVPGNPNLPEGVRQRLEQMKRKPK
jgi:hypothetical protein